MTLLTLRKFLSTGAISLFVAVFTASLAAQTVKVEGQIKGRSGNEIILQTSHNPDLIVILNDDTEVSQAQGVLKARRKEMSMAALIPGLPVKIEGTYNATNGLVAKSVTFTGADLEQAQAIQAGVHETQAKAQKNQAEIEKQNAELKAQNVALQQQQAQLAEQQAKIAENKKAIDAAVARFGQLDDYYIHDEVTVYFANGQIKVDPKYKAPLLALSEKAKTIDGYMIEVKGYASSVGGKTLNQQLSEDRADKVTNILLQDGHVPLTRMLAPAAMGESRQVGNDKTAEGQAEDRRVVVRVLQNKAIAGV